MKEHPILFNTEMVRAILDNGKCRTTRPIKKLPDATYKIEGLGGNIWDVFYGLTGFTKRIKCPYGSIGDRLWIRETWTQMYEPIGDPLGGRPVYKADNNAECKKVFWGWTPSIHMPRWASRIILEVTKVDPMRLQDITPAMILAEGIKFDQHYEGVENPCDEIRMLNAFQEYWDHLYPKYPFVSDPWCWGIEFRRI